jgi:Homeodomain-like domain
MLMRSPYQIVLSDEETAVLMARARSVRAAYRDRLRARIVLAAAAGKTNAAIAADLGICADTVRKWRRHAAFCLTSLISPSELQHLALAGCRRTGHAAVGLDEPAKPPGGLSIAVPLRAGLTLPSTRTRSNRET